MNHLDREREAQVEGNRIARRNAKRRARRIRNAAKTTRRAVEAEAGETDPELLAWFRSLGRSWKSAQSTLGTAVPKQD